MKYREFGNKNNDAIMLLHGGGLSWWSQMPIVELLQDRYYCIVPTIDGHGDDEGEFESIHRCADSIVEYIQDNLGGQIYAICGLSIGAQIAAEVLSRDSRVAHRAIIESTLVYPMKYVAMMTKPIYAMSYGLIKRKWFAKYQARSLFVPDSMFESYFADSSRMSRETLINMTASNSNYPLPLSLADTQARVLVLVGGRELPIMKRSANAICNTINDSTLMMLEGMGHGEISLLTPEEYVDIMDEFFG